MEFQHSAAGAKEAQQIAGVNISQKKEVEEQVDILIKQATNHENLAACYIGWCPYW
jgi:phosphatidylinositol kinase/protein kinase (PI-3  family)